jgi:hypothetical protein
MVIGLQSQENPHAEGDYRVTMGKAVSPGWQEWADARVGKC